MKQLFLPFLPLFFTLLVFSVWPNPSQAQGSGPNEVFSNAQIAIKEGSAKALARYFAENMDLALHSDKGTYSPNQAQIMMQDFFSAYPPNDFEFLHTGSSSDGLQYGIAKYISAGKVFSVYMVVSKRDAKVFSIETLNFSLEE